MHPYITILFDLDGTLTDPQIGITKSVQYALRKMGINESDRNKLIPFIGPPLTTSFRDFYELDETQAWQAVQYYREYFSQTGIFENAVYPGIPELLAELRRAGKVLVVATSKPEVFARRILEHFHLMEFFSLVVGSQLNGSMVEKGEVIACVLNQLAPFPSQSVVMVGDRKHDIIGARQNNIEAIAVGYGYGTPEELQQAEPDFLATTVEELRDALLKN